MNKSALAFFFLFLLYGFSIGSGQQGISYNVLRIAVRWRLRSEKLSITTII